jgi:hypothetical protein
MTISAIKKEIFRYKQQTSPAYKMKMKIISMSRHKILLICRLKVQLNTNQENHYLKTYLRYQTTQTE